MRAVADDIDLARVSGINVDRVVIWTWLVRGLTALGMVCTAITAVHARIWAGFDFANVILPRQFWEDCSPYSAIAAALSASPKSVPPHYH